MKCSQIARAMALPVSMYTTALDAYFNSNTSCNPDAVMR